MKKTIAIILTMLMVLAGMSTALTENASALPPVVPASSVDDFVGIWNISGFIYNSAFYSIASWEASTGKSLEMYLQIGSNDLIVFYESEKAIATIDLNSEDGSLAVRDSSGEGKIQLLEDGTIVFQFDAIFGPSYSWVFAKAE